MFESTAIAGVLRFEAEAAKLIKTANFCFVMIADLAKLEINDALDARKRAFWAARHS